MFDHHVIVDRIKQLAHAAAADPLRAQAIAKQIEDEATKLHHHHPGSEIGTFKTFRVPNIPQLAAAPAANSIFTGGIARWPMRAMVVACYGCCIGESISTGVGDASVGWQVLTNGGDRSLVINGQGQDFMLFRAAFGSDQQWYPIAEEVSGVDTSWGVNFRNLDTGGTHTPEFYFRYIPLPHK